MARGGDKSLLRFITCGSVDDGKSTLLGRLIVETGSAFEDELEAIGGDYSRLLDGLEAEQEQGITIDLAYRFFATARRKFVVADAPGHEQFTRNFVSGASSAELALVLVDASRGVVAQTRRHAFLARLLGVRQLVLLVNKMDLVGFDEARFEAIVADFAAVQRGFVAIPVSALGGDNVAAPSAAMPWYRGPELLRYLERVEVAPPRSAEACFRMPVQWVNRPGPHFRGYAGTIAAGSVRPGDAVKVLPAGTPARVGSILLGAAELTQTGVGEAVTLTLDRPVECSRGNLIVAADDPAPLADRMEASLIWLDDEPLVPGRQYWLKLGTQSALATMRPPRCLIDPTDGSEQPGESLAMNGIGVAELWTDRPILFAPYEEDREQGGFILIDRVSNATAAAGLVRSALGGSGPRVAETIKVTREARAAIKGQKPRLLWFTGLSGAGKSTIANMVEERLHALGRHTVLLDGDNVRMGLSRDLGFSAADRAENIRRVGETAKLMLDAGLIVLAAFISPFRAERRTVRALLAPGEFVEIHLHVPLEEAERRDRKGLYRRSRAGEVGDFTGVDSPYEEPEAPELRFDTSRVDAETAAERIVAYLLRES